MGAGGPAAGRISQVTFTIACNITPGLHNSQVKIWVLSLKPAGVMYLLQYDGDSS